MNPISPQTPTSDGAAPVARRAVLCAAAAALAIPPWARAQQGPATPQRGLWLRIGATGELDNAVAWLSEQNRRAKDKGRPGPWIGLQFYQTWGEIEREKGVLDLKDIRAVLDAAKAAGLAVMLQVSDKERQYRTDDSSYRSAIPLYLDAGPLPLSRFAECPDGVCQDEWRYATVHDMRERGKKANVRKYAAKRWALQEQWRSLWTRLGSEIGAHPALYAVLTAESALALPNRAHLERIGYPGQDWYVEYLVGNAKHMRSVFPERVQVVSNVNLVPPNTSKNVPKVLSRLAEAGLSVWAQDLLPDSGAYRTLYAQLARFPVEKRWAMVTNEGRLSAAKMVGLARELNVGHLAFINRNFPQQIEEIERLPAGQASFMPPS